MIGHTRHRHPLDAQQTANVVMHPLFLLVRVFDNAKPARSSGCLYPGLNSAKAARPPRFTRRSHLLDSEWLIASADGPCAELAKPLGSVDVERILDEADALGTA